MVHLEKTYEKYQLVSTTRNIFSGWEIKGRIVNQDFSKIASHKNVISIKEDTTAIRLTYPSAINETVNCLAKVSRSANLNFTDKIYKTQPKRKSVKQHANLCFGSIFLRIKIEAKSNINQLALSPSIVIATCRKLIKLRTHQTIISKLESTLMFLRLRTLSSRNK